MKNLFYVILLLISTTAFASGDQGDGEEYYSCSAAIDISMGNCALWDDYDQDHSYDETCIAETMQLYGFTKSDYELENNNTWPSPGYNDYICSSDIPDYD